MLDLAISVNTNEQNVPIVETNRGAILKAPEWPHDCDFQLVVVDPVTETCEVVSTEGLTEDIGKALRAIEKTGILRGRKPD
jgi:hypothetical protein